MIKTRILFICNGNIFRSLTAEYALKFALGKTSEHEVRSAGLVPAPHEIVTFVHEYMEGRGIDISGHAPAQFTGSSLGTADLAVAMGTEHRDKIADLYGVRLPLFSEVAYGTVEPLLDVFEVVPDWRQNETEAAAYGCSLMDYIFDGMEGFIANMGTFTGTAGKQV